MLKKLYRKKFFRRLFIFLIAAVIMAAIEEAEFWFRVPDVRSEGGNGIWIRRQWVDEERSSEQYKALVSRFHQMGITDVYFHAGPLDTHGKVPDSKFSGTARLIKNIKNLDPKIRMYAWLGQVAKFGGGGPSRGNDLRYGPASAGYIWPGCRLDCKVGSREWGGQPHDRHSKL